MDATRAADVVEVVVSWDGTVLEVEHVPAGKTLTLGEQGDILLPAEILGEPRFELVRYEEGDATVAVPPGAVVAVSSGVVVRDTGGAREATLERGQRAELVLGRFSVRVERVLAERCKKGAPLAGLRESSAGYIAGSAFFHVTAFLVVAFVAPSLGATEEDPFDSDRLALMQRLIDASAAREAERPHEDTPAENTGGVATGGAAARDKEGAAGRPDTTKSGRWAAKGDARPENATLAAKHAMSEAATFGMIGLLPAAMPGSADAPVVTWGTVQNGADAVNANGTLYGAAVGDGWGTGGLGLQGPGEGGGGTAMAIGLHGVGGLGHTGGSCDGPGPCDGIGVGHGRPNGGHTVRPVRMRPGGPVDINGRLDPQVIQRVVRLNAGRSRACYEAGLRTNPSLTGRVTVKFMIDRTGAVSLAADGGSDLPDEAVRRCVVSSFLPLSFPAPENGTVSVVYPILFSPE